MRVLIATDAWAPEVNGVVRTLTSLARTAPRVGMEIVFLSPEGFSSCPVPSYPGLHPAIPDGHEIARRIEAARADALHIATEGPIGHAVRGYCIRRRLPFTTSVTTKFPEYIAARFFVPAAWSYGVLRRFHAAGLVTTASTASLEPRSERWPPPFGKRPMRHKNRDRRPGYDTRDDGLMRELRGRGFRRPGLWTRGVDTELFTPERAAILDRPRPVFLNVGRVAVDKNLKAFLSLDLPGSKVVIGAGPQRDELKARQPDAHFLAERLGADLAAHIAAADVFVFPSRTDTDGVVQLEALACGVPVAAFPVTGPRDVIGGHAVGVRDDDLRAACLGALTVSRAECRAFALGRSWEVSARQFARNVARARIRGPIGPGIRATA